MFNPQINAVLTLIALSIFADKRVLSTEITAFVKSADIIQKNVKSPIPITETKLLMWFELNRGDIQEKMRLSSPRFKQWFDQVVSELPILRDKSFISKIVGDIAKADGELHISEKALSVMLERRFDRARASY